MVIENIFKNAVQASYVGEKIYYETYTDGDFGYISIKMLDHQFQQESWRTIYQI
jgi:hypothetical protein